KDEDYILKVHVYDDSWEVVSHQNSEWNHINKELTKHKTLYASKLRVKTKEYKLTIDDLIKRMKGPVEPVKINTTKKQSNKKALGLYFTDLHFGINTVKDYEDVLASTIELLNNQHWEEIIVPFGSDLLHVDNLNNTTANQTRIQDVDIPSMIDNAKVFYKTLIDKAINQSNKVTVLYIAGNHDLSTSYLLSHWLAGHYKDIEKVTVCKD